MPSVRCSGCGFEVSSAEVRCPRCGVAVPSNTGTPVGPPPLRTVRRPQAPPPLPAKPRFTLPAWLLLACVPGELLLIALSLGLATEPVTVPYMIILVIGTLVFASLLGGGIGWAVFYLAGKSRLAGNLVAFCMIFMFALLPAIGLGIEQASDFFERRATLNQVNAEIHQAATAMMAAQQQAGQSGAPITQSTPLRNLASLFRDGATRLSGDHSLVYSAIGDLFDELAGAWQDYENRLAAIVDAGALDVTKLESLNELRDRIEDYQAMGEANTRLDAQIQSLPKRLNQRLAGKDIDPAALTLMRQAFLGGFNRTRDLQVRMRELDAEIVETSLGMLSLLREEWGRWQIEASTGTLLFVSDSAAESYTSLFTKLAQLFDEQRRTKTQILPVLNEFMSQ